MKHKAKLHGSNRNAREHCAKGGACEAFCSGAGLCLVERRGMGQSPISDHSGTITEFHYSVGAFRRKAGVYI